MPKNSSHELPSRLRNLELLGRWWPFLCHCRLLLRLRLIMYSSFVCSNNPVQNLVWYLNRGTKPYGNTRRAVVFNVAWAFAALTFALTWHSKKMVNLCKLYLLQMGILQYNFSTIEEEVTNGSFQARLVFNRLYAFLEKIMQLVNLVFFKVRVNCWNSFKMVRCVFLVL